MQGCHHAACAAHQVRTAGLHLLLLLPMCLLLL
jgi:hypothetical protein